MKVSGIYEPVKNDVGYVMVSKTFLEEQEEMISTLRKDRENRNYYNAHVILKDPSMVEERIGEFIRSIGGNPDDREAENYVRIAPTPSATQSDGNLVVWLAAGVFGILFMFGGYLLIYNVFNMSVTNDVRQYGLAPNHRNDTKAGERFSAKTGNVLVPDWYTDRSAFGNLTWKRNASGSTSDVL